MRNRWTYRSAVAATLLIVACDSPPPTGPEAADAALDVVLVSRDDLVIPQNDATIGCPYHIDRGYGFRLDLHWQRVRGVAGSIVYDVEVRRIGSTYPFVRTTTRDTRFTEVSCNSFVIDSNLDEWVWRARALHESGEAGPWSDEREFRFAPCRHDDGRPCSAPPPPGAEPIP